MATIFLLTRRPYGEREREFSVHSFYFWSRADYGSLSRILVCDAIREFALAHVAKKTKLLIYNLKVYL